MEMLIYKVTLWACDKVIRSTRAALRPVYWVEGKAATAWLSRQPVPGWPNKPGGFYNWAEEHPQWSVSDPQDWPKPQGPAETCPVCGQKEFPLTPYDGIRMCLSCKDDAVITDKAIPSTIVRHVA
jgi:hypothetical protein